MIVSRHCCTIGSGCLVAGVTHRRECVEQRTFSTQMSKGPSMQMLTARRDAFCEATSMPKRRVGIIADPQVRVAPASLDDQPQWSGSTRYYRNVLGHVREAALEFKRQRVAWVVDMGDLIDNGNARAKPPCSSKALAAIEKELILSHDGGLDRIHHLIGNNDVQNFNRSNWAAYDWARRGRRAVSQDVQDGSEPYTHYYEFKPFEDVRWRFVMLDSYVVSIVPDGELNENEAKDILRRPGKGSAGCASLSYDAPLQDYRKACFGPHYDNLSADDPRRRFTWGNGGFGSTQLNWLTQVLTRVRERGDEQVIVFAHNPIHPDVVNDPDGLAYDYDKVLDIFASYDDVVVAFLAGHDHIGGYTWDETTSVHHLTVPSPLEAAPGTGSRFLVMELGDDHILLKGSAAVPVDPIKRAFLPAAPDSQGSARTLAAQTLHRYINFASHWGVIWHAKQWKTGRI